MTKNKIIVALDVESADEARKLIDELHPEAGAFKIGLQLFLAAGGKFVRELVDRDIKIFLDLKFHDIPNTVANASIEAARLGVWMFNIHALGGSQMIVQTVDALREFCAKESRDQPLMIGVTVLTSSDDSTLLEIGINEPVDSEVIKLAKLCHSNGLNGIVASPKEIEMVRSAVADESFLIVTPGIRPDNATNDDQKRVMTPTEAVALGADHLVIGRPITRSKNPKETLIRILGELDDSLNSSANH